MTPHIHAASALLYAHDMQETDEPWLRWEYKGRVRENWHTLTTHPVWAEHFEYRRKPTTIKVPAVELPEPLRVEPKEGQAYYTIDGSGNGFFACGDVWRGSACQKRWLTAGQIFSTREACQAWADHFNAALKGEVK